MTQSSYTDYSMYTNGMYQLFSSDFGLKDSLKDMSGNGEEAPQEQETTIFKQDEVKQESKKRTYFDTSTLRDISIEGNKTASDLEQFGLSESDILSNTLFSSDLKSKLVALGNISKSSSKAQENVTKNNLIEILGVKNSQNDNIKELGQFLDIENNLYDKLPQEAQSEVKGLQDFRYNFTTSLMEQFSKQWGEEYNSLENLPDEYKKDVLDNVAQLTSEIIELMINYTSFNGFKEA